MMSSVSRFLNKTRGHKRFIANNIIYRNDSTNARTAFAEKYSPKNTENAEKLDVGRFELKIEDVEGSDGVYSLVLPPPNVTGSLHLGHALTATIQDVLCRWHRMNGSKVCWVPGFDHAGIATQIVVEKYLKKQNTTRYELGYEQFQRELWKWKERHESNIRKQLLTLGMSLDWSRTVFTMDPKQSTAVNESIVRLFDEGLIYKSNDLVNWCCSLKSTISDIEINNTPIFGFTDLNVPGYSQPVRFGSIYEIAYKVVDGDEEIVVATTRPETLLGDVAVAVHPKDSRYSHLVGRSLRHPLVDKTIPVIADGSVDITFGTGAVKITPAHDRMDHEVSKRLELPIIQAIDRSGRICEGFSIFSGMKRYDARALIVEELKKLNLLRSTTEHEMVLPICSRSGDVIEQLLHPQWYIDCKRMAEACIECVNNKSLSLIPKEFENVWIEWSENHRDWCISRQLWWGHRIPIYKCFDSKNKDHYVWIAAHDENEAKSKAKNKLNLYDTIICEQENDVLDTWFSSAIYPFSSHGWPEITSNYEKLYPLSIMVTGHDILRFWVHRMVMLGTKLTGCIPFSQVLLHGIICDANGAKMSKSKGNVIDPQNIIEGITLSELHDKANAMYSNGLITFEELNTTIKEQKTSFPKGIPECGADALRFTLCSHDVKNVYIHFDVMACNANKLFCNKIWQSVKFATGMKNTIDPDSLRHCSIEDMDSIDLWMLSRLSTLVTAVRDSFDNFNFHYATAALYRFFYNEICDTYIEFTKQNYRVSPDEKKMIAHSHTFSVCFNVALRLLLPFMPYMSNELITHIPLKENCVYNFSDSIENITAPRSEDFVVWKNTSLEDEVEVALKILSVIRKIKSEYNLNKKVKPLIYIESYDKKLIESVAKLDYFILALTAGKEIVIKSDDCFTTSDLWAYSSDKSFKVYLDFAKKEEMNVFSSNQDIERSLKKKNNLMKNIKTLEKAISTEKFKGIPQEKQIILNNKMTALKEELCKIESILSNQNAIKSGMKN